MTRIMNMGTIKVTMRYVARTGMKLGVPTTTLKVLPINERAKKGGGHCASLGYPSEPVPLLYVHLNLNSGTSLYPRTCKQDGCAGSQP